MINFDDYFNENKNWTQPSIDKIYLYAKDPYEDMNI